MKAQDLSTPCLRKNHDGCNAPNACACACHGKPAANDVVVWEEPPTGSRSNGAAPISSEQLAALKANPGRWARFASSSPATAHGRAKKVREGHWPELKGVEAVGRKVGKDGVLYARWPS